jgi:hypothetical protein
MNLLIFFWLLGMATLLYLLPSIIAYKRRHRQFIAILALNVLLGWTLLGWVGAFVWALMRERRHELHSHLYVSTRIAPDHRSPPTIENGM